MANEEKAFSDGFDAGQNEALSHLNTREVDAVLLDRALSILHRLGTERTGWRSFFSRWYYPDEPLRNDAANLVRQARFGMMMPIDTRLVGDKQ